MLAVASGNVVCPDSVAAGMRGAGFAAQPSGHGADDAARPRCHERDGVTDIPRSLRIFADHLSETGPLRGATCSAGTAQPGSPVSSGPPQASSWGSSSATASSGLSSPMNPVPAGGSFLASTEEASLRRAHPGSARGDRQIHAQPTSKPTSRRPTRPLHRLPTWLRLQQRAGVRN